MSNIANTVLYVIAKD